MAERDAHGPFAAVVGAIMALLGGRARTGAQHRQYFEPAGLAGQRAMPAGASREKRL